MERDLKLLMFVFKFKAVTFKQIRDYFFKRDTSTVSRRLIKLRKSGLVTVIAKGHDSNSSLIFGLTKNGFNQLTKHFPDLCFIERFKSNSIFHDVALVEIENVLKSKRRIERYWTENLIQSSRVFADDDSLSFFRDFNFDGLIRYDKGNGDFYIFAIEYENSQKSAETYKSKLSQVYLHNRPQAILYICKDESIERAIRKAESEIASNKDKKLYFIKYDELTKGERTVTFVNQDSKAISLT